MLEECAAELFRLDLEFTDFDIANAGYYAKHRRMMHGDWEDRLDGFDAIYFGAVG